MVDQIRGKFCCPGGGWAQGLAPPLRRFEQPFPSQNLPVQGFGSDLQHPFSPMSAPQLRIRSKHVPPAATAALCACGGGAHALSGYCGVLRSTPHPRFIACSLHPFHGILTLLQHVRDVTSVKLGELIAYPRPVNMELGWRPRSPVSSRAVIQSQGPGQHVCVPRTRRLEADVF